MQCIITKYHGPTNTRGSRISAESSGGGDRVYIPYPHELSGEASPDLYAALHGLLQAAADVIEIHGADIWPDLAEDETPDLELWAARARAALAKAGHPA